MDYIIAALIGLVFATLKGNLTITINHTYPVQSTAPQYTSAEVEEANKDREQVQGMVEALNSFLFDEHKKEE